MPFAVEVSGLVGVVIVLMGAWGFIAPGRLTDFVSSLASKGGLVLAVAIRVVAGVAFWFAAPESRAPLLLQTLGVLAIVAAVVLVLTGPGRYKALLDSWGTLPLTGQRIWCLIAVAFGAVILWALLPTAT
jgi:hypothetical protein